MNRDISKFLKLSIFAFSLYYVVASKDVTHAAVIPITDCDDPLNSAGDTYELQNDISTTTCTISADNIAIDGQGLYTIEANVLGVGGDGTDGYDFSLINLTVDGDVSASGGDGVVSSYGGAGGNITISTSTITGSTTSSGGFGNIIGGRGGNLSVTNSTVGSLTFSGGNADNTGGDGGTISVIDSTAGIIISNGGVSTSYEAGNGGSVTVSNSVTDNVISNGGDGSRIGGLGGSITVSDSTTQDITSNGGDADYGSVGGDISITDSMTGTINNYGGYSAYYSVNEDPGTLTITDNAPTLTLLGDDPQSIAFGSIWSDPGATADDAKDGDLTGDVTVTGTPNTSLAGDYEITYEVTDLGTSLTWNGDATSTSPSSVSDTRTVTVLGEENTGGRNSGGRSGGGSSVHSSSDEFLKELMQKIILLLQQLILEIIKGKGV